MTLSFTPRRQTNAISEFTATINLFTSVSPGGFSQVIPVVQQVAADLGLPAPMNMQVINFSLGQPNAVPTAMSGIGFQRHAPDGEIEQSLWCDQNSLQMTFRSYPGWADIEPRLVSSFDELLRPYLREVPAVAVVALGYVNEFRSEQGVSLNGNEVFNTASRWIAPVSREADGPWHCHVGKFETPADGVGQQLINVNSDVLPLLSPGENSPRTYVKATLNVGLHFNLPDTAPLILEVESLKHVLESIFRQNHVIEKRVLNELVSKEYISLMGPNADAY